MRLTIAHSVNLTATALCVRPRSQVKQARMPDCTFCGRPAKTGEHIIPRWLQKYFEQTGFLTAKHKA